MRERGAYKILSRSRSIDDLVDPLARGDRRMRRIVESLRSEILEGGGLVRIRQVFENPRQIYRLELELPAMGYQRTTLLDRDALEELLAIDEVRALVRDPEPPA
jgi:signal transduction histidine kinase